MKSLYPNVVGISTNKEPCNLVHRTFSVSVRLQRG